MTPEQKIHGINHDKSQGLIDYSLFDGNSELLSKANSIISRYKC